MAVKVGPPRERRNSRITRSNTGTFWRQVCETAGSDNDPMGIITGLRGNSKPALESCPGLQIEYVSTLCIVNGLLQVVALTHFANSCCRGCI